MKRPSAGVLAVTLAGATIFGGAVAAQSVGGGNSDVPTEDHVDDGTDARAGGLSEALDPNPQVYNVPAAAFTPDGANPDSQFFPIDSGYFQGNAQNYGCLVAPVQLPQGARVNELTGILYDNDVPGTLTLELRRVAIIGGGAVSMASVSTAPGASGSTQTIADDSVVSNLIDNARYSYFLTTCLLSVNMRINVAKLSYQEELVVDPHSPVLVPVTPFRVYDSRLSEGPLAQGANRLVSVRDRIDVNSGVVLQADAVPSGATAIMFNLGITNTVGGGFVAVTPGTATVSASASINWSATGQTLNNGTFVQLDANRMVKAFVDGSPDSQTNFIIDITGYLIPGT